MEYPTCSTLIKNYFSNITYIDDKFDVSLIKEKEAKIVNEEIYNFPPLPKDDSEQGGSFEDDSEQGGSFEDEAELKYTAEEASNLHLSSVLLELTAEEKYEHIRLRPVLYKKIISEDILIKKMEKAPLNIIDWNLGNNQEAFPIVHRLLSDSKQLKVVIVYTNAILDAHKVFLEKEFVSEYNRIDYDKENIYCYQTIHKSLLVIAAKQNFNLDNLLDAITNLYICHCGLMPATVFSILEQIEHSSGDLFEAFCKPFEDIYLLQMYYSELNNEDIPETIENYVLSKIKSDINIDSKIFEEIYEMAKNRLVCISSFTETEGKELLETAISAIVSNLSNKKQKKLCRALKVIPYSEYKKVFESCENDCLTWQDFLDKFDPIIEKLEDNIKEQYNITNYPELGGEKVEQFKPVLKEIRESLAEEIVEFKKKILPVFIQVLVAESGAFLSYGYGLVSNLKYHFYKQDSLEHLLSNGEPPQQGKEREHHLMNRLHFGDILIEDNETKKYLLCITPPCDVFRPNKTDMKMIFIKGEVLEKSQLSNTRKENVHLSAMPVIDAKGDNKIRYITWRFFDIKVFDFKDNSEYVEFSKYKRPFRMDEQYTRQIANKFTAFFSRAGVEELFMKDDKNLIRIFT